MIVIEPSDDAFGVVNFTSWSLTRLVTEGETVHFGLQRSGGALGDILIGWEVENGGGDLGRSTGNVLMGTGIKNTTFQVVARDDVVCTISLV